MPKKNPQEQEIVLADPNNTSLEKVEKTVKAQKVTKFNLAKIDPDNLLTKDEKERIKQLDEMDFLNPLIKSAASLLDGGKPTKTTIERLAFESNPYYYGSQASIWIPKEHLVPSFIQKRVSVQCSLVASIVRNRSCHMASFGSPQKDRYSAGFKLEPVKGVLQNMTPKQKDDLARTHQKDHRTFNDLWQYNWLGCSSQINI